MLGKHTTSFTTSVLSTEPSGNTFPQPGPTGRLRGLPFPKGSLWKRGAEFPWASTRDREAGGGTGASLPGAVHLVRVAFHLDGDPGRGLRQPVLLRDARAHLGGLPIVAGGGGGHVRLRQVRRPVGALEQRLVLAHHR